MSVESRRPLSRIESGLGSEVRDQQSARLRVQEYIMEASAWPNDLQVLIMLEELTDQPDLTLQRQRLVDRFIKSDGSIDQLALDEYVRVVGQLQADIAHAQTTVHEALQHESSPIKAESLRLLCSLAADYFMACGRISEEGKLVRSVLTVSEGADYFYSTMWSAYQDNEAQSLALRYDNARADGESYQVAAVMAGYLCAHFDDTTSLDTIQNLLTTKKYHNIPDILFTMTVHYLPLIQAIRTLAEHAEVRVACPGLQPDVLDDFMHGEKYRLEEGRYVYEPAWSRQLQIQEQQAILVQQRVAELNTEKIN